MQMLLTIIDHSVSRELIMYKAFVTQVWNLLVINMRNIEMN